MARTKSLEDTRREPEKTTPATNDQSHQGDPKGDDGDQHEDAPTRSSKKRTKSGCLTCRKRRIKCDEGRPICQNCIKSKRHCDGYHQRVLFKPANIDFRHFQNGATAITFPPGTLAMPIDIQALQQQSTAAGHSQLRPRPVPEYAPAQPYPQPYHGLRLPQQNSQTRTVADANSQQPIWTTLGHDTFGPVVQPTNAYNSQHPTSMVLQHPFVPKPHDIGQERPMAPPSSHAPPHVESTHLQSLATEPVTNSRRTPRVRLDQIPSPRVASGNRINSIPQTSPPCQTVQKSRDSVTSGMCLYVDKRNVSSIPIRRLMMH